MTEDMSPRPRRQPMVTCGNCGRANDPGRGSARCWYCDAELPSSELQLFDVEGHGWRFGQDDDRTPWAVAADVAKSFDYRDARDALRMLDDEEKGTREVRTPGGPQQMKVVFEDGLWELIFRSTKPEAKAIKKRVKAILREIRETGSYSVVRRELPQDYSSALRALADEHDAHQITQRQRDAAELRAAELAEPAAAWNVLAEAKGDYSLREAAQILNRDPLISTGQNRLARYLRDIGWTDTSKQPYQHQVNNGRLRRRPTSYAHPHTGEREASSQVRITPKGLKDLRRRMAGQQPLVVIEGSAS